MARNNYYRSIHWRTLRAAALKRDRYTCAVLGCGAKGTHVDHIRTRPKDAHGPTPLDTLGNLRTLCAHHDAQVKEQASGKRRQDGKLIVKGATVDGTPLDPNHPWHR